MSTPSPLPLSSSTSPSREAKRMKGEDEQGQGYGHGNEVLLEQAVAFRLGIIGDTQYCDEDDFTCPEMQWVMKDGKRDSMQYPVQRIRRYRHSLQVLEIAAKRFTEVGCDCSVVLGDLIDKNARKKGQAELEKCQKLFLETIEGKKTTSVRGSDGTLAGGSRTDSKCGENVDETNQKRENETKKKKENKWLYVFGNNDADLLTISDHPRLDWIENFVPNEVKTSQHIDTSKIYFDMSPVAGYRIVVLDCFEVNPAAGTTVENRAKAVKLLNDNAYIMRDGEKHTLWNYNDKDQIQKRELKKKSGPIPNDDWAALYGLIASELDNRSKAYMRYNGGISDEQLHWLELVLQKSQESGEIVVVCGHLPVHPLSARADGMLYNFEQLMDCFTRHNACVKAYIAGHDHDGGYAVQDGVHYMVLPSPLNCDPTKREKDFGYLEFLSDRSGMHLVWEGNGPDPSHLTIPPYGVAIAGGGACRVEGGGGGANVRSGWPTGYIPF